MYTRTRVNSTYAESVAAIESGELVEATWWDADPDSLGPETVSVLTGDRFYQYGCDNRQGVGIDRGSDVDVATFMLGHLPIGRSGGFTLGLK